MVSIAISWISYHILLPITLIASVIFRYNIFSSIYLILVLVYPYAPYLTYATKGKCCSYSAGVLAISLTFILAQIGFQVALLATSPYGELVGDKCTEKEKILRYIGLERLDEMAVADVFRFLLPDVLCFLIATLTFVLLKRTVEPEVDQQQQQSLEGESFENETSVDAVSQASSRSGFGFKFLHVTSTALKNAALLFITIVTMALAGIANPSLFSGLYLVVFMLLMTIWSLHGRMLGTGIAILRVVVSIVAAVQLVILFFYQMEFFQNSLPANYLGARLMGLTPFVNTTNCQIHAYELVLNTGITWTEFISPPLTFLMYWMLAMGVRVFFTSDKNKLHSHGSSDRRKKRRKDERMVRSKNIAVPSDDINMQLDTERESAEPLVQEEVTPHAYDAINAPSTSVTGKVEEDVPDDGEHPTETKQGFLHTISDWMSGLKNQSFYVIVLIVMMAWSVTFHSWLTLVLLIWSCILWLVKDRSWSTLVCSPAITIYAMMLICLQFVYSLNLTETELPSSVITARGRNMSLASFGMIHYFDNNPSLFLGAQILYTCVFWIVLHQFVYIRRHKSEIDQAARNDSSWLVMAATYIREKLSKYWILFVYGFLLAICVEGKPSGIKLIYALYFTLSGFVFELSWVIWRKTQRLFLFALVIYTMIVVLLVYTYQFDEFPGYWKSATNFTNEQLRDLGLIKYEHTGELLLRICIPTFFLLVVILQIHYFHDRFLQLTKKRYKELEADTNPTADEDNNQPVTSNVGNDTDGSVESIEMQDLSPKEKPKSSKKDQAVELVKKSFDLFLEFWYGLIRLIWRLLEFHMWKLLIVTVLVSALQRASAVFAVLFVTWVVFIPIKNLRTLLYIITSAYVGFLILGSMFYQLDFITLARGDDLYYNCTFYLNATEPVMETYDFIEWLGFSKMTDDNSFFYHSQGLITVVIMLALERIVARRQEWRRYYRRELKLPSRLTALYPSISHNEADNDFISCCKFFLNYWFYKFGVEACYIMAVITIWMRADSFGVIYSILFIISMALKTRKSLARYWKFYVIILMSILIGEYAIALGMPPMWCTDNEYPWTTFHHTTIEIRDRLIRWLYLPDYIIKPYSTSLVVDVFQILFIICQLFVFEFETTETALSHGGDNKYLTARQLDEVTPVTNSKPNFMLKKYDDSTSRSRNVLDQFKSGVFKYSFWVTCAIVFIAGTSRISLFCMGYLIAFFYLLSFNQSLLMGKPSNLLRIWNIVLGYNVAVIVLKISLQITSCVYIDVLEEKACIFVQLMSLVCARPEAYAGLTDRETETCATPNQYTNAGLTWDFICFMFLIIQRRIFQTYYFLHVSEDLRISMKLASRGAELFEEKLIEEVNTRKQKEEGGVTEIRENMASISKRYAKLGEGHLVPQSHTEAMRSGDYYMFEDQSLERETEEDKDKDILNPLQMLHTADTVGIDKALEDREVDKKLLDEGDDHKPIPKETWKGKSTENLAVDDDVDATEQEKEEPKKRNIFVKGCKFIWELFLSGVDTFILWLNTINCDYRNVALQLSGEKDELAQMNLATSPREDSTEILIEPPQESETTKEIPQISADDVQLSISQNDQEQSGSTSQNETQKSVLEPIDFDKDQMRILRLFYAIWYTIISRTDVVCYMLVILNLMLTASIMSLVLPITIFLWSSLSTPRPTSRFWNFCIIYLEIVIMIKFLFQFEFFPWNADNESNLQTYNPFWWPRIIGIEQKLRWSALDLAQLLAFFFHRSILKVHGLWNKVDKNKSENGEEIEDGQQESKGGVKKGEPLAIKGAQQSTSKEHTTDKEGGDVASQLKPKAEEETSKLDRFKKACTSPYRFYRRILTQEFSAVTDVYIYIFLCDVINFIIIIFGYWAFGKYATEASDVVSNISSNKVPTGFLVMLLIQFGMMFIDRALYLRKNLTGKLIFQVCLVIGVHVWMFFLLPYINERPFYMNGVAQTWYFFKAVYFLLSAYQIRCGYPTRVLGNFLTKAYGTANLFLFKGYRMIPFLAELTAVMDWMFIETTMGIGEWFKFQSIYAEVFELKCWRVFEKNYPSPRTTPKSKLIKYLVGGLLVFFLIAIIWFPLLFMNIVLTIGGLTNNPEQVSIQITVGTFEPLFQVIADSDAIRVWSNDEFNEFAHKHADNPSAALFLSTYSASQVVSVTIDGESKTVWAISPPQQQQLLDRLSQNNPYPVQVDFEWHIIRNSEKTSVVTTSGSNRIFLSKNDTARSQLYKLLKSSGQIGTPATIKELFPRYVYSGPKSISTAASKLYSTNSSEKYVDTDLSIRYAPTDNLTSWWRVVEVKPDAKNSTKPQFELVVFSDKVSPASLSFLVSYGIIGLYVSIVLVVGKLVRGALVGSTSTIMFQELPRVDRILQLCLDIFLVREEHQFQLEEDLYAKLIFLYRSPQTLILWTRPKQE
ncbi:piezo-type mechanosensitive ion channel component 1-like isoform X4 [Styela clava]